MSFPYEHVYSLFSVGGNNTLTQLLANIPHLKKAESSKFISDFILL